MKLNPEELEIVSFPTEPADADLLAAGTIGPQRPTDPTPDSRCFVCD